MNGRNYPRLVAALLLTASAGLAPPLAAGGPPQDSEDYLRDGAYLTACGPIACFVALRSVGVDSSLKEMARACHWRKGELTTLASMDQAINLTGEATSTPAQVSLDRLAELVDDGRNVAILPVRKGGEEINHAVCVARAGGGEFYVIDYPELGRWRSASELANIWDGQLLLVSRERWTPHWLAQGWWAAPAAGMLGFMLLLFGARARGRGRNAVASARV